MHRSMTHKAHTNNCGARLRYVKVLNKHTKNWLLTTFCHFSKYDVIQIIFQNVNAQRYASVLKKKIELFKLRLDQVYF